MNRLTIIIVGLSSFAFGVGINRVFNSQHKLPPVITRTGFTMHEPNPVRVTVPPIKEAANNRMPYDHYYAIVENMSSKPVRYYVLGFGTEMSNVAARGVMSGNGFGYTYPDTEAQALVPGETRMIPIKATAVFSEEAFAWVDYVEFMDGSSWGPNKSAHKFVGK